MFFAVCHERFEDTVLYFFRHAGTGIGEIDAHKTVFFFRRYRERTSLRHGIPRIAGNIVEDADHFILIHVDNTFKLRITDELNIILL